MTNTKAFYREMPQHNFALRLGYNVFNRTNYRSYTTEESNARYGQPTANRNIAYQPRAVQLGFRFAF